ncbi:MAG TPA: hypothetical protein VIF09_13990 [Polyangiaceae bacterium]|jgi:hypothetical protein
MRRLAAALLLLLASGCASTSRSSSPCGNCSSTDGSVAAPRPPRVEALARQRVELARKRLLLARASFEHGTTGLDDLFAALRDVAFAARDSGFHGEALRSILTEYRDAVVALQALTHERVEKGAVTQEAMSRVEALVAEAQYWLAESSPGP